MWYNTNFLGIFTPCKSIPRKPNQTKTSTTKKMFHKNNWNWLAVQVHVEPTLFELTKSNNKEKSDKIV